MKKILTLLFINSITIFAATYGIKQMEIDETKIYEIKLHPESVVTLLFPVSDGIEGIHGVNVTKNSTLKADFFVEFNAGTNFISLRATPTKTINEKTPPEEYPKGSLNIVYKKKVLVIKLLYTNTPEEADKSISFIEKASLKSKNRMVKTTPGILVSLVEQAKGYELYKKYHPEALENIQAATELKQLSVYEDFDILVHDAFRFDKYDTVVLRLFLHNKSEKIINLDIESFAVRVGDNLLHASIVDCADSIPPQATVPAYVGFTGSEYGGRNNLAPDNKWKVIVSRNTKIQEKIENEKLKTIYNSINDSMTDEQLEEIEKIVETIQNPNVNQNVEQQKKETEKEQNE